MITVSRYATATDQRLTPAQEAYLLAFEAGLKAKTEREQEVLSSLQSVLLSELLVEGGVDPDNLSRDHRKPRGIRKRRG